MMSLRYAGIASLLWLVCGYVVAPPPCPDTVDVVAYVRITPVVISITALQTTTITIPFGTTIPITIVPTSLVTTQLITVVETLTYTRLLYNIRRIFTILILADLRPAHLTRIQQLSIIAIMALSPLQVFQFHSPSRLLSLARIHRQRQHSQLNDQQAIQ